MLGEIEKYGSGIARVIRLFRESGLESPTFEICGSGLLVKIFAKKTAKVDDKDDKKDDKDDKNETYLTPEESVFNVINQNEGCKVNFIAQKTGFSSSFVKIQLANLVKSGKIEYRGSKKTGGYYVH